MFWDASDARILETAWFEGREIVERPFAFFDVTSASRTETAMSKKTTAATALRFVRACPGLEPLTMHCCWKLSCHNNSDLLEHEDGADAL